MNRFKIFVFAAVFLLGLQTADAGWRKLESGTLAWLHAVYFLDEKKGWIAGSQGTFLQTSDGGETWRQPAKFTADAIRDVYFHDEQTGWILCERDRYALGGAAPSYLMKTSDGGASWEKMELDKSRTRLSRLIFDSKGAVYAVGEGGVFYALSDDRKTWKKGALPVLYRMLGGSFTGDLHGVLVGGGGTILFTEDAGMSWNKASFSNGPKAKLSAAFFINSKIGWTVGAEGKIFATSNGGRFWREQNSNVTKDLTDVFFINTAEGYAVGDEGLLLHTLTAGNVWTPVETSGKHRLERISFAGKKGFAVGFGGTILIYESGEKESRESEPQMRKRSF